MSDDPQRDDLHEQLGRLEGKLEGIGLLLAQYNDDLRGIRNEVRQLSLVCPAHNQRITALEAQMALVSSGSGPARRPPSGETQTGDRHRAITKRDIEDSQRIVLEQAAECAEETVERELDRTLEVRVRALETKRTEERQRSIKGWLQIIAMAVSALAGAGIVGGLKCELPRQQQQQVQQQQRPASQPARR